MKPAVGLQSAPLPMQHLADEIEHNCCTQVSPQIPSTLLIESRLQLQRVRFSLACLAYVVGYLHGPHDRIHLLPSEGRRDGEVANLVASSVRSSFDPSGPSLIYGMEFGRIAFTRVLWPNCVWEYFSCVSRCVLARLNRAPH